MCYRYHINKMVESVDRSTGSNSKKFKGSFSYKTKYNASWFSQQNLKQYKDVITQSKLGESYFHCKVCNKDASCSHCGASDLLRHCTAATHQKLEKGKTRTAVNRILYIHKKLFYGYSYEKSRNQVNRIFG